MIVVVEPALVVSGGALLLLAGVGVFEAHQHQRSLGSLPIRIHVNGTRGKSLTTRVLAAMSREMGLITIAKVTGETPTVIEANGTERKWQRRGRARIQEQVAFLRYAARQGAEVVVLECMALQPRLQQTSEQLLVKSHIGVITNARLDHLEEMGNDYSEIARSLSSTVPYGGTVVLGEKNLNAAVLPIAKQRHTHVLNVDPAALDLPVGLREAVAIAQSVAGLISTDATQTAMALKFLHDGIGDWKTALGPEVVGNDRVQLLKLWTMNDPDSLERYWDEAPLSGRPAVFLYNHRSDRPLRARAFARFLATRSSQVQRILVTGDPGAVQLFQHELHDEVSVERLPRNWSLKTLVRATADIHDQQSETVIVIGCGNWRGLPAHGR